jgi:hypothetical protein
MSNQAQVVLRLSTQGYETTERALKAIGKDGEKALAQLEHAARRANKPLGLVDNALAGVSDRIDGLADSAPGADVIRNMGPWGTAAAAGLAAVAFGLGQVLSAAQKARDMQAVARSIDLSVEALQRFEYAAAASNMTVGAVSDGLAALTTRIGQVTSGLVEGETVDAFAQLGFTPDQLRSFTDGEERILAIARALSEVQDVSQRRALAEAIGAEQLLPLLSQGEEGLRRLGREAENAGAVLDNRTVAAAARLDERMDKLHARASGAWTRAWIGLGGVIADALEGAIKLADQVKDARAEASRPIRLVYDVALRFSGPLGSAMELATRPERTADQVLKDIDEARRTATGRTRAGVPGVAGLLRELDQIRNGAGYESGANRRRRGPIRAPVLPPPPKADTASGGSRSSRASGGARSADRSAADAQRAAEMEARFLIDLEDRRRAQLRATAETAEEVYAAELVDIEATTAALLRRIEAETRAGSAARTRAAGLVEDIQTQARLDAAVRLSEAQGSAAKEAEDKRAAEAAEALEKRERALEQLRQGSRAARLAGARTAAEAYAIEREALEDLRKELDALVAASGADGAEARRLADDIIDGASRDLKRRYDDAEAMGGTMADAIAAGLVRQDLDGPTSVFADLLLSSLEKSLRNSPWLRSIEDMFTRFFSGIFGGAGSGGGGNLDAIGQILGSAFGGMIGGAGGPVGITSNATIRPVNMPGPVVPYIPRFAGGGMGWERPGGGTPRLTFMEPDEAQFTPGQLKALVNLLQSGGGGRGGVEVNVHTPPGTTVEQRESTGPSGTRKLDLFLKQSTNNAIASGGADEALRGRFGARPQPRPR